MGKNELFILFILKTLGDNKIGKLRPHKRHDENPWEPARVGRTEHKYNNTFAPLVFIHSRTLLQQYGTLFFLLIVFSFMLFFYRGQGTFIRFNFIALGNAIESAAWSIIGNRLATSCLRNAERLFPWRGTINKVLCRKAPPLSS